MDFSFSYAKNSIIQTWLKPASETPHRKREHYVYVNGEYQSTFKKIKA